MQRCSAICEANVLWVKMHAAAQHAVGGRDEGSSSLMSRLTREGTRLDRDRPDLGSRVGTVAGSLDRGLRVSHSPSVFSWGHARPTGRRPAASVYQRSPRVDVGARLLFGLVGQRVRANANKGTAFRTRFAPRRGSRTMAGGHQGVMVTSGLVRLA
ncbi:hypothetical protein CC85DRAFT_11421 [Cutaneotrichosporon oleaginosum]|uniref:Uncharacterized protein n=1 Tax=Cutaneotrichosporon oleaginosum TaxID=879819 RepID=A0A0J0XCZ1_9TREE|nr:uncharacterized protein CC85DRAFT_11421 [Cutaneotrichosporon oleaginosum]KLT38922.1 hypothetical protein CC85DRAFT_11421 [Cutaneotrichosporon oleaginosum]TXT14714.1 hypothetical protein COLE_00907 [Cutaneotrichosporon oleaginosum]